MEKRGCAHFDRSQHETHSVLLPWPHNNFANLTLRLTHAKKRNDTCTIEPRNTPCCQAVYRPVSVLDAGY